MRRGRKVLVGTSARFLFPYQYSQQRKVRGKSELGQSYIGVRDLFGFVQKTGNYFLGFYCILTIYFLG